MTTVDLAAVDGRVRRRERGRTAVVDVVIELILAGPAPPTIEDVAERAGVSLASVFRYFGTLDELRHAAIERWLERSGGLMAIPDIGEHALAIRIRNLVDARLRFHEEAEPVARFARRQATVVTELRETLARVRATLTGQLAQHFEPELRRLRPAVRRERLAVLAALTSFESWDLLQESGLDREQVARAWRQSLDRLLRA